jgi:hypothetical protein
LIKYDTSTVKDLRALRVKFPGVGGIEIFTEEAIEEAVALVEGTYSNEEYKKAFVLPTGLHRSTAAAAAAGAGAAAVSGFAALRPTNDDAANKLQAIGLSGPPRRRRREVAARPGTIAADLEQLATTTPTAGDFVLIVKRKF